MDTLSGIVRVDERVDRLTARLEAGDIAVIDQPDLERADAAAIAAKNPKAVLNIAPSMTGRRISYGAALLVEAGIPLLDDLGTDATWIHEGETISIVGGQVWRKGELIAEGQVRTKESLLQTPTNEGRLELGVQAFAQGAALLWRRESQVLLEGVGVPKDNKFVVAKTAIISGPSTKTPAQLRKLVALRKDRECVIIGVGEGTNHLKALKCKPDIIVGDVDNIKEKLLFSGAKIVLLERPDGSIPGVEKMTGNGLDYSTLPTSANALEAAILLANVNGAEEIIVAGQESTIGEFFDQSASEQTASFFIRLRARDELVSAQAAAALYKPRISNWQLLWIFIAALLVIAASLFFTPWGNTLGMRSVDWFTGMWSSSAQQFNGMYSDPAYGSHLI